MGVRRLTDRQERNVCELIESGWRYREIAESMGIKVGLVQNIAIRNGLSRTNNPWTEGEVAFLKANYRTLGLKGCARRLHKTHSSISAVCHKARQLGLTEVPDGE